MRFGQASHSATLINKPTGHQFSNWSISNMYLPATLSDSCIIIQTQPHMHFVFTVTLTVLFRHINRMLIFNFFKTSQQLVARNISDYSHFYRHHPWKTWGPPARAAERVLRAPVPRHENETLPIRAPGSRYASLSHDSPSPHCLSQAQACKHHEIGYNLFN